ncbi:MAG TPA: response regulator, partial [Blastocatellia bacterium]|nr:response regulator [Blastocatellia bacterium]
VVRLPILSVRGAEERPPQSANEAAVEGAEHSAASGGDLTTGDIPKLDGVRILVVDDEEDARKMLEIMLIQFGAEVKVSDSAQEALKALEHWKPDVLVSDIGMPNEDGYSLIHKVRALGPERGGQIPAVALTGYSRMEDRSQLLAAGYQVHLSKPVILCELARTIASLHGEEHKGYHAPAE